MKFEKVILASFIMCAVFTYQVSLADSEDYLYGDVVRSMRNDPFIRQFAPQGVKVLTDGSQVALPAAWQDGIGWNLYTYADLDKVNKLLALEGLRANPHPVQIAPGRIVKMARVVFSTFRYSRVSYGPSTTARLSFDAFVDKPDFANPKDFEKLRTKDGYVVTNVQWRFWHDAGGKKSLSSEVIGFPVSPVKIDFDYENVLKTMVMSDESGQKVLDVAFLGKNLPLPRTMVPHSFVLAIMPGNKMFNPQAYERRNVITHVSGINYAPVRFNASTDRFEAYGQLAKDLEDLGFRPDLGAWVYTPTYSGVFEPDSVSLIPATGK